MAEGLDKQTASRLLVHFEGRQRDVLSLTRALCEIESPSGDLAGSRAVADRPKALQSPSIRAPLPVRGQR